MLASGCTSLQPVEPRQFIPDHKPRQLSVWTAPDDVLVVENPMIVRDSLVGAVFDSLRGATKRGADTVSAGRAHRVHVEGQWYLAIDTTVTLQAGNQRLPQIHMKLGKK